MASSPLESSHVELLDAAIAKPQPLRIIKRSQTITGGSTPREILSPGGERLRGRSGATDESKGSPPMGPDRPLTIHKVRKVRTSVLDGLEGGPLRDQPDHAIMDLIRTNSEVQDDPDLTPKARQPVARTMSAGAFLRSELFGGSSEMDSSRYSMDGSRDSREFSPDLSYKILDQHIKAKSPPKIPERRASKSKDFFLKAIGGRNPESKRLGKPESTTLKGTLLRRLSRGGRKERSSSRAETVVSLACIEPDGQDITDVCIDPRISCYGDCLSAGPECSHAVGDKAVVLCPSVIVTPEISSVGCGSCSIWVAVEITGSLRRADGYEVSSNSSSQSSSLQFSETSSYGHLYAMHIDILPGRDCVLEEIIGDLHDVKTIRANETQLILAKIRLRSVVTSSHIRETSDELMTALENELGDTFTRYLTIRLAYKHSGFPNSKIGPVPTAEDPVLACYTHSIQVEATAIIKRHDLQSTWSPRTSRAMNIPLGVNPLINLIETHFATEKARQAIHRLAEERMRIPKAKKEDSLSQEAEWSEDTLRNSGLVERVESAVSAMMAQPLSVPLAVKPVTIQKNRLIVAPVSTLRELNYGSTETDPARKIWTQMRRSSRGGRHPRRSITASNYYSMDDDCNHNTHSFTTSSSVSDGGKAENGAGREDKGIESERNRIIELAIKNKRSLGADSLRSIAPSTKRGGKENSIKGVATGLAGLGLGSGRTWGWGSPWW